MMLKVTKVQNEESRKCVCVCLLMIIHMYLSVCCDVSVDASSSSCSSSSSCCSTTTTATTAATTPAWDLKLGAQF